MSDAELAYLQPTTTPTASQDPSTPSVQSTDAETTGRTDGQGSAILRQRVATPTIPNGVGKFGYAAGSGTATVTPAATVRVTGISAWGGGSCQAASVGGRGGDGPAIDAALIGLQQGSGGGGGGVGAAHNGGPGGRGSNGYAVIITYF
jgi:hypothetical protein